MSPITHLQKKVLFINISTALKVMFGDFGKSYVYFLYKLCLTLCREQDPVVPNSPMLGAQHLFHSQLRWYLLLVFCFVVVVLFLSPSVSSHRSSRHYASLSELLKICQKLQYREKCSSKQINNKHIALRLYPSDA